MLLGTVAGAWRVGADPRTGMCVAIHTPGPVATDALFDAPDGVAVIAASSWDLESRLGWVLPDAVHGAVRAGRAVLAAPAPGSEPAHGATADSDLGPVGKRMPAPSGLMHVPGQRATTYRRALAASRVAHAWTLDGRDNPADRFHVDIVALRSAASDTRELLPGRRMLLYRLRHNHQVIFAGDDIEAPAGLDVRGDDTLRRLLGILLDPQPDPPLTPHQQAFLTRHTDELRSLTVDIPGPYGAGTRVAVHLPDGTQATGTILDRITDRTGTVRSYGWHPDDARLPGHPWQTDTDHRNRIVSPAGAVTAT
ncbi:hypothetical protein, partial [Candidatus Protofrankia californiensis]|uniref:hypothetical protein n=1 Tax=Candidatus Protofrankia californiensis TaxID=1839754 RepID=UPI00104120FD